MGFLVVSLCRNDTVQNKNNILPKKTGLKP